MDLQFPYVRAESIRIPYRCFTDQPVLAIVNGIRKRQASEGIDRMVEREAAMQAGA